MQLGGMCGQDLEVVLGREAHGLTGVHHEVQREDASCRSVHQRVTDPGNQEMRHDGREPGTGPQDHPVGG